jgi:hypothetical protein
VIECPVCLNQNEEKSLFCAECGQRFTSSSSPAGSSGSAGSAVARFSDVPLSTEKPNSITPSGLSALNPDGSLLQPPNKQVAPKRPSIKLHSPILDGGGNRDFSNGDEQEGDDVAQSLDNHPIHHGLHSPLLDREASNKGFNPRAKDSGSHFPHRNSGEFAKADFSSSQPRPARNTKALRSPLLGGADETGYDFEPDENYFPEDEEIDDPNVLRSPLLASKLPLTAHAETAQKSAQPAGGPAAVVFPAPSNVQSGLPKPSSYIKKPSGWTEDLETQSEFSTKRSDFGTAREGRAPVVLADHSSDLSNLANADIQTKFAGYMMVPLILAVCLKTWYLVSIGGQIFSSLPFLSDQVGQLIVMIFLIAYALTISSSSSR